MGAPGFSNDNRFRAYPLVEGTAGVPGAPGVRGLPDSALVDCGFVAGPSSGYDPGRHSVRLRRVRRAGTAVTFEFASDAPGLAGSTLTFRRGPGDPDYAVEHADAEADPAPAGPPGGGPLFGFRYSAAEGRRSTLWPGLGRRSAAPAPSPASGPGGVLFGFGLGSPAGRLSALSPGFGRRTDGGPPDVSMSAGEVGPCELPPWWGFLQTGYTAELFADVSDGADLSAGPGDGLVEPALVQSAALGYVSSVSVANKDRTRAGSPAGCGPATWPYPGVGYYVHQRCLVGPLRFAPGYNLVLTQDDSENSVAFGARPGAGAGYPAEEPRVAPWEEPGGLRPLSGGPWCSETVRSVNGLAGPDLRVSAGSGASVTSDPAGNRVVVDLNLQNLDGCLSDYVRVSESL